MIRINENHLKLKSSYLFSEIAKRVAKHQEENPDKEILKLGIGDVTKALPPACIEAFHKAVDDMADDATFKGYRSDKGYPFLREKIADVDFKSRGIDISTNEIFISDGAKCDTANIQELFAKDIKIAIPDPVYPVYIDTNVMAGRTGNSENGRYKGIIYLDCNKENGFVPELPKAGADLIYLCFPNNPTGAAATKEKLKAWVNYARKNNSLILYDAAYVAFIRDESIPHSIFEIEGAKEVAMEFRSLSKTAGFTGTRCAYTIIPEECNIYDNSGNKHSLNSLWDRRQATKFNGVSYPVQRAAEAVFTKKGQAQAKELIDYYLANAAIIRKEMEALGYFCTGGNNSPYIWVKSGMDSWDFFDMLLNKAGVVCTPGSGFGKCGEGYIRISAFNSLENVKKAMQKISAALSKEAGTISF